MGVLTGFLQEQFASCCPPGWRCRAEVPLVDKGQMSEPTSVALWGNRQVQYLAFDPVTHLFAPSKFCAFVPTPCPVMAAAVSTSRHEHAIGMKMSVYATFGEGDPRFDGHLARVHLQ